MEYNIEDDKYWFRIKRNNKLFLNLNYLDIEKFQIEWSNITYRIELNADDNNHIFSFFGKNGIGKTTICKKITENEVLKHQKLRKEELKPVKIIRMRDKLDSNFNSVFPMLDNYENRLVFFHQYFSNENLHILLSTKNFITDSAEESLRDIFINDNIKEISDQISEWAKKKNINIQGFSNRNQSSLYILIKSLEDFLIVNKINILDFINEPNNINIENNILNILNDSLYNQKIWFFIKECFKKLNSRKEIIKKNNIENNKLVENLLTLQKEFESLSQSFMNGINVVTKYNSFFDSTYSEIFIINKKDKHIRLHDFLDNTSEGENKLVKLFFLLSEIKTFSNKETVIIADDIFNSFDNKNIIHIISLIKKIINIEKPIFILFTHDFEIFRIVNKDLNVKTKNSYILRRKNKNIYIENLGVKDGTLEEYIKGEIKIVKSNELSALYFLSCASCIREDVKRLLGSKSNYYKDLTSLLHIKKNSMSVLNDLSLLTTLNYFNIFKDEKIDHITGIEFFSKKHTDYFSFLDEIYEYSIKNSIKEFEFNIFLALYGRILIERILLNKLIIIGYNETELLSGITTNQTTKLIELYELYTLSAVPMSIINLNKYLTKFIHVSRTFSYLINLDNEILLDLIHLVKSEELK